MTQNIFCIGKYLNLLIINYLYNQLIDIYIIEANTKSENVISLIFSTFVPRLSFSVASRDKILSLDVILRLFSIKSVKIADI